MFLVVLSILIFVTMHFVCKSDRTRIGVRLASVLLAALSAILLAPSAVAQSYPENNEGFQLSGTVVNSVTGEPVRRALVQTFSQGKKEVLTDSQGHFEFSGLQPGQIVLTAQKPGFFSEADEARESGGNSLPTTTVGPDTPPAVVKLTPEAVFTGRVVSDGEPLENVPVMLMAPHVREGRRNWEQVGTAMSDEEGAFRVANLPAGTYYAAIGPSWRGFRGRTNAKIESGYPKVFYPAPPEAGPGLALTAGQHVAAEVPLKSEAWYRVKGSIRLTEGEGNAGVWLADSSGDRLRTARFNQSTGTFELEAPAGAYSLEVRTYGQTGETGRASVPLTVNGDMSGIQVTPGPPMTIPVRVKMEATTTRGERSVQQAGRAPANLPVQFGLRRTGFSQGPTGFVGFAGRGSLDTLAVRNVDPGTYWLEMTATSPWYVQSAHCGEVDLLRENLTIGTAAPCAAIDVVLRDDAASLSVNASGEGDASHAAVLLVPEHAPRQARTAVIGSSGDVPTVSQTLEGVGQIVSVENTDQASNPAAESGVLSATSATEFTDLAPGDYRVLLLDNIDGLEYTNPEALAPYMSKAVHVTLGAKQKTTARVEMIHVER